MQFELIAQSTVGKGKQNSGDIQGYSMLSVLIYQFIYQMFLKLNKGPNLHIQAGITGNKKLLLRQTQNKRAT